MLAEFLIALGVMVALAGALALTICLAEFFIANYGDVTITVNGRRRLEVRGGRPLLSTLKEESIFIPSACGGRGSCGLCKVRVLSGAGAPLPTELPSLDTDEQRRGVRLSCQLKVKADLSIEIPDELFSVRQFDASVASIRDLTHDIKEVRLQLRNPAEIEFVAGQFVQIEVPPYELTDEVVYRAYSIASEPAQPGEIELEIRYVPNGICTTYIHKHLKVGDPVRFNGPYGSFFLRDSPRDIIAIAGGSGMAPIKSILLDLARRGSQRRIRYFFGARSRRDLFLTEEMTALERRLGGFRFIPALSQPLPVDDWQGERGLITEVVARHVDSAAEQEAYLCGSPLMIDACIKMLSAKGMPETRIFYDKFA